VTDESRDTCKAVLEDRLSAIDISGLDSLSLRETLRRITSVLAELDKPDEAEAEVKELRGLISLEDRNIPTLGALLDVERARADKLAEALEKAEWSSTGQAWIADEKKWITIHQCPICESVAELGHEHDCQIGLAPRRAPRREGEGMKYRKRPVVVDAWQTETGFAIDTLEGTMRASPGDWIITGVNGEKYPCKPDIFEKTYEPADKPTSAPKTVPLAMLDEAIRIGYERTNWIAYDNKDRIKRTAIEIAGRYGFEVTE
jgi:hypothetical protein